MLKRRGLLGTRSPRTHNEAAFCALNAHTEADHRLQRSHQVAHSPSPQCSNAEVYSVRDHRTRTMRQLLVLRSMRTQKRTIGFTKKPSSRTFAESSMLKRRGLLGTRSPRTHRSGPSATQKPSSRTFAESSMLKRRGLLGTRSPNTHNEAAFGVALNAHTGGSGHFGTGGSFGQITSNSSPEEDSDMPPLSPSHAINSDRGGGDDGRTGDQLPLPTIERARHWEAYESLLRCARARKERNNKRCNMFYSNIHTNTHTRTPATREP